MSLTHVVSTRRRLISRTTPEAHSTAWLFMSELVSSVIGFGVMIHLARRLGPASFGNFEYAAAVSAWWLVVVRGGFDTIVYREAARRPQLVRPLMDVLLGLRAASAVVGLVAVGVVAWSVGTSRGVVVLASGLLLMPSAMACDVGLRSNGRFRALALAQVARAFALAVGVAWLVAGPGDPALAAGCVVAAELGSSLVLLVIHSREHGLPWPRFRPRAWWPLMRRGAMAGLIRFGRVTLYAADMLALGSVAGSMSGPYAAARRVAFALLALGLVVPTALAPRMARAWVAGAENARSTIEQAFDLLLCLSIPATVGLMATSTRWMPCLFGEGFRDGGPWLALIAARLPFVLASNVQLSALIACRREGWALWLIAAMVVMGGLVLIPAAVVFGLWGVGVSALVVEVLGAVAGWFALRRLGVAPPWHHRAGPILAGCLGLILVCRAGQGWPLGLVVVVGALVHGLIWCGLSGRPAS